jgi:hypothetical protein
MRNIGSHLKDVEEEEKKVYFEIMFLSFRKVRQKLVEPSINSNGHLSAFFDDSLILLSMHRQRLRQQRRQQQRQPLLKKDLGIWGRVQKLFFLRNLQLTNGPNVLECLFLANISSLM